MGSTVMLVERLHPGLVSRYTDHSLTIGEEIGLMTLMPGPVAADEYFDQFLLAVADEYSGGGQTRLAA